MPTIEEGLGLAATIQTKRDSRRKEVIEAQAAIADEVMKQAVVDTDTSDVTVAITNVQNAAAAYKLGDDIQPIKDLFLALFQAEGTRVLDTSTLVDAIAVLNKEQGEADTANADEDAAIASFSDWAHSYVKEGAA